MGSSEGGEGGIGMECGVGTIVWVRRRNGSWWPGRILGQHELSASHLMSPRSGTPVKLLGREDASVDWYNLEKSKRVKAFRCGEFDACIERAEASLGGPMRKREKYARREDAILHALELEKRQLEVKELPSPLIGLPKLSDEPVFIKPKLSNSQSTREDETSGSMPRIKDSQKKLERSKPSIIEDQDDGLHDNSLSVKRKRPQGTLTEDSLTKRRDRRRPLAQVLKSSAKLEVLVPPQPSDSNSGDKFLPEDSAGNSSDDIPISLVDYGFASNGLQVPASSVDDTASSEMEAEDFLLEEAESFLDDDEDAVGKISGGGDSFSNDEGDDGGADPGMSMWHLKGKRNVRAQPFYPKKKGSGAASRLFNGGGDETELSEPSAFGWSSSSFWAVDEEDLLELPRNRTLIEVDLKVQTSYQGERVPLVSLMSRLNGKAIIGHPVPVEILEDGGAADLAAAAERALGGGADAHPAAAPVWRTGRRTAMHRVPRAHLVPSTEDAELDCGSAIKKKVAAKAKKKLQKKGMISLSNQKTRTLSSIVTERRRSGKSRHGGGGLIKPGSGVVPPVTCVPITVVFSRIMEAVGRPPSSMAGARRSLLPPQDTRPSSSSSSLL